MRASALLAATGLCTFLTCAAAPVQAPQNPLADNNRMMYGMLKVWVRAAAEKMPEENYGFKPTPEVRAFGEIVGHVADMQYHFCSVINGEPNPKPRIEKTKTSKTELLAALKDAYTFCDRAYARMTDASAAEIVKLDGRDFPRLGVLQVNALHTTLHYGNLITYLRLKNIVPPSSDPAYMPR